MDLFVNDLSIHEQFNDLPGLRTALSELMTMRQKAKHWDRELYCNRQLTQVKPFAGVSMLEAVQHLPEPQRRSFLAWLTRGGPFWEDDGRHAESEWLESGDEIVTGSAVGEAAYRSFNGIDTGLVSVSPSRWAVSPVSVLWRTGDDGEVLRSMEVRNWWRADDLSAALEHVAPPLASWGQFRDVAVRRFDRLVFGEEAFEPLAGIPFAKVAADRLVLYLHILNWLADCFEDRKLTREGHQLRQQYFMGDKALFSDSSATEKAIFKKDLTFPHPDKPGEELFCPWHGKMSHHLIRLHFSWPIRADEPVYVVYVGRKITTR